MQRITKLWVLSLAVGVNACNNLDEVVPTTAIPTAGVRFINAVPDTNTLDMRFVDIVENNAQFNVTFRNSPVTSSGITASTGVQYKPAMAGAARHFRIFLASPTQSVASVVLKDTTVTLTAGSNYTAILWGSARLGTMKLSFFEETVADPGTNIALRVLNGTAAAIDAEQYTCSGTGCATGAATGTPTAGWSNIPSLSASAYFTRAPGTLRIRVTPTGSPTTPLTTDGQAMLGSASSFSGDTACTRSGTATTLPYCDTQANGGSLVAGSAISAIVFPGSVPGSNAAQFNTTTGAARARVTAAGYEGPRSYVTDGFQVGQQINASGFTNGANNGLSTITAVTNGASRATSATVTFTSTGAGTFTRNSGSFITDGFVVGNMITSSGWLTAANNAEFTITGVAAGTLTVTSATLPVLEGGTTGSTTLGANAGGYTRTAGSFIADGFLVGHAITATGFTNPENNGASVISFVDPDGLNIAVTKTPVTSIEAPAAGRTLRVTTTRTLAEFGRLNVTKGGGTVVENPANARTIAASPNAPGVSYVWDRRPPKGCFAPYC